MDRVKGIAGSRGFLAVLFCFAVYVVLACFLEPERLIEIMRAFVVGIAMMVTVAYAPAIWRGIRQRKFSGSQRLILGILLSWTSILASSLWGYAWRLGSKPEWMVDHSFVSFVLWVTSMAGCLHVMAPGAIGRGTPRRNFILMWTGISVGTVITMVIVILRFRYD